jgi:outer membrane protein TolC
MPKVNRKLIAACLRFLLAFFPLVADAQQSITIEECREKAFRNYLLDERDELYGREAEASVDYLRKWVRPEASAFAVISLQSDVPDVEKAMDFSLGMDPLSRDQYRTGVVVKQLLYDGGEFRYKRELTQLERKAGSNRVYLNRILLENRVDDIFFEALESQKSAMIVKQKVELLQERLSNAKALFDNGKILLNEVLLLEVVLEESIGQWNRMKAQERGLRGVLSALIGEEISPGDSLVLPRPGVKQPPEDPFYRNMALEKRMLLLSGKQSLASAMPRAYLFGVGGYASPALDIFDNSFKLYGVVGFSVVVPITAWRDHEKMKRVVSHKMKGVDMELNSMEIERRANIAKVDGAIDALVCKVESARLIMEKCERLRSVSVDLYDAGEISSEELSEAVTRESNAMLEYERCRLELLRARVKRNKIVTM